MGSWVSAGNREHGATKHTKCTSKEGTYILKSDSSNPSPRIVVTILGV